MVDSSAITEADPASKISLHAITGSRSPQTMKLEGNCKGKPVFILIDSGSTHSLVNFQLLNQLGAEMDKKDGLKVMVANGKTLSSPGMCRNILLQLGPHSFSTDLFSLPIVQLQTLLLEFSKLFSEPSTLPPRQHCDHKIVLEPDTRPVAVHPYRYPHVQKDEIERQCSAMLQQCIIRPSHSPFSSPVILVPKTDGTWRLCIDYRELNSKTMKNKFSIPVIDELLEEFGGAQFYQAGFKVWISPGSYVPTIC